MCAMLNYYELGVLTFYFCTLLMLDFQKSFIDISKPNNFRSDKKMAALAGDLSRVILGQSDAAKAFR